MTGGERYNRLIKVIHEVDERGDGTNVGLAEFCQRHYTQTSRWFWKDRPTVIATATVTLRALRWVCLKRSSQIIIPDWEALRFFFKVRLRNNPANSEALASKLSLERSHITQYFRSEKYGTSREPKGDRALQFLACANPSSRTYLEFFTAYLEDYPYPATAEGSNLRELHNTWIALAETQLRAVVAGQPYRLPKWLKDILV